MRILVATDGSELSRHTADYVARMSQVLPLEVHLALVVDFHKIEYKMIADLYLDMLREGAQHAGERVLEREAEYLRGLGVTVTPRLLFGAPAAAVCETAAREGFALVALGRRGHGDLQDVLFGSVSNQIVHRCPVPTLTVRQELPARSDSAARRKLRVMVAVDGSFGSDHCLDLVVGTGAPADVEVSLLGVVNPAGLDLDRLPPEVRYKALEGVHQTMEAAVGRAASRLREAGFRVNFRVEEGKPGPMICRIAEEEGQEIVVVGRRGLGEIEDILFGSVSHHVLHHCPSHVLLVP